MPTLNWIGKEAVIHHHSEVPYRLLRCNPELSIGDPDTGNLLVEGDNLLALKALLPYYAGQVKCIYIDPPYNTGNENWVYNDNVNSPEIQQWLGEVVGKESEDLSRHDKWLCMMYPRLTLLRNLLSVDGSIWVSIDDHELEHARMLLNEVFGRENFVATIIWQKVFSPKNSAKYLSEDHDYILVYARKKERWDRNLLPRTSSQDDRYSNPDGDPRGPWMSDNLTARNPYSEGIYPVTSPGGRELSGPPKGTYWRVAKSKLLELDADGRIWWGEEGTNVPRLKRFLAEVKDGVVPQTLWRYQEVGHTQEAKKQLLQICDFETSDDVFVTPKPTRLIRRILQIATGPDDLVLDSFAGTGTTAQAVMEQNAQDGGNRRFILVELDSKISRSVMHQRVTRVIRGYPHSGNERTELLREKITVTSFNRCDQIMQEISDVRRESADDFDGFETKIVDGDIRLIGKKKIDGIKDGLGGGFRYCELAETLFDAQGQIRAESVTFSDLARHIFFSETGTPLAEDKSNGPLLGVHSNVAVYLLYNGIMHDDEPDNGNVLTRSLLKQLPAHDGPRVIYANRCLLSRDYLDRYAIIFRQTPYAIKVN